jgi:predicted Zn-ribbon and HTH transcriptional regulator
MLPVAERAAAQNRRCELGDIFRNYGDEYRQNHALPLSHLRVMRAVERCRTAALGGHLRQCDACGFEHPAYNSCTNRHCPKCQSLAKARWLEKQELKLLPVGYFHLVLTVPHELNRLILVNKNPLINILFHAVSEALLEFARTHLGGTLGLTTVLHTWDQTLLDHFHLHCLVPAGALSFDQTRWIPARKNFLFPVTALSIVFRGKFLDLLKKAYDQKKLLFPGQSAPLADGRTFMLLLNTLRQKPWVVYAKKPFASPHSVLDYLGRYTHRVALSNNRILSAHNGEVTFSYRDRKNHNQRKFMKLKTEEFIRRFLLHVIPKGLMRVRHFGFLANNSKERLSKCRELLGLLPALPKPPQRATHELMLALTGIDLTRCPRCRKGTLIFRAPLPIPPPQDSS